MDERKHGSIKTQWAYMEQKTKFQLQEPTDTELAQVNPMAILSGYKLKSNIRFGKSKSAQNYFVEMTPKQRTMISLKIEVVVGKNTGNLVSIKMNLKTVLRCFPTLSNYQKGIKVTGRHLCFLTKINSKA